MKIVLLSGQQGSGKSTLQNLLIKNSGRARFTSAISINFADALYRLHNVLLETANTEFGLPITEKDRVLLQVLGTEWGRRVYGDKVWINIVKTKLDEIFKSDVEKFEKTLVIIADCRFRNEFEAFPEALRVRLFAPLEERKTRAHSWGDTVNHPSETDLDGYSASGVFDMYLHTGKEGSAPDACAELVLAKLQKDNWKEKRNGRNTITI